MSEHAQARFDSERLEARLSHVDAGLEAISSDLERMTRLATIGTAAGMIAHEIRGLLTPVRAYAQMALNEPGDEDLARKALEKAVSGSESAVRISETILALVGGVSQDAGERPVDAHPEQSRSAELALVVGRAVEVIRPILDPAGVRLDVDADPAVRVAMGEIELQQVLVNLLENAAKAMPDGGTLSLRAGCSTGNTPTDPGTIEIEVADTGRGMSETVASRVFEPFYTGEGSARGGGAGLGLALCEALVAQARGRISVATQPGAGTRFRIMLPAA